MKIVIIILCCFLPIVASMFGIDAWNWIPKMKRWQNSNPPPKAGKARIRILDTGRILSTPNGNGKNFEYIPTIALIEDGPNKIVFDTGLPTDEGSPKRMIDALKRLGLHPNSINKVILSHSHLDHTGHASIFTKAKIYHGNHMFNGYSLTYIGTYEFGGYNVTDNVKIVPTPGHTPTCISALVTNAETLKSKSNSPQSLGIVAITGDLFFKVEDLKDSSIWKSSSRIFQNKKKVERQFYVMLIILFLDMVQCLKFQQHKKLDVQNKIKKCFYKI